MLKRLYVVVRADLPAGLQLAQACHATRSFGLEQPELDVGENLVVLHAKDAAALGTLVETARKEDLPVVPFHEPDLDGAITAAAFTGAAQKLLSTLPLALRPARDTPEARAYWSLLKRFAPV